MAAANSPPTVLDDFFLTPWAFQDEAGVVQITAQQTVLGSGTSGPVTGNALSHVTGTTGAETVLLSDGVTPFSFTLPPGQIWAVTAKAKGSDGVGNNYVADHSFALARNASGAAALVGSSSEAAQNKETDGSASGWAGLTFVVTSNVLTLQVQSASGVLWKVSVQVE